MSNLIQCFTSTCSIGDCFYAILDVIGPIILEIIFVSIIFQQIVEKNEKRKWNRAKAILLSRLLRIQDDFLLDLIPDQFRKMEILTAEIKGIHVDLLFSWLKKEPNLDDIHAEMISYITGRFQMVKQRMSSGRENINQVIQAHSVHIEPDLFGILLEIDTDISKAEIISRVDEENIRDYVDAINKTLRDILRLRKWLFDSGNISTLVP